MFWGLLSQVQDLKVGVPNVGFHPFTPQEEAPGFESPPDCGPLHQGWDYAEIVSHSLNLLQCIQ